ncbi:hypothetical protein [Paremcibacter congregatus]|uniref:Uncharacterized protein n=1 Tax=Paremcibacter congregatus TaxID=2043170 RepID=A0A2G4YT92_9PROT|nr:hypothetical protein [Paremcibacter congregatus]PHZ85470.1 hypothetical protein CRD36_06650 [Paremcibacter congregatus]QDE27291.1 hypothetical protein FIV45_08325 [Paremcibacter congregatus]
MNNEYIPLPRTWCGPLMKNITPSIRASGCATTKTINLYLEIDTHSVCAPFVQRIGVTDEQISSLICQLEAARTDVKNGEQAAA